MTSHPFISIVIPCFNQAQYMDECLQSVYDQSFDNWECIIVNDGSPDTTEEVAKKWTEKDNRFKYLLKENGGLSSARNAGIEIANGQWILPLDCDDRIASSYLQIAKDHFNEDTIVYCQGEYFGDKKGIMKLKTYDFKTLLIKNMIFCTFFFQKKHYQVVEGYDETFKEGYEDWDFLIRLIYFNNIKTVYRINQPLFFYRIKHDSMLKEVNDKFIHLRERIYLKNKKIYDQYYTNNYSYLIYENQELRSRLDDSTQKLKSFYNHPMAKIYYKIKNLFHGQ